MHRGVFVRPAPRPEGGRGVHRKAWGLDIKETFVAHVVHFEISVPNPEVAVEFYSQVFGWSIQKLPDPVRYWQIGTSEAPFQQGIPGGIVQSKTGSPRVSVTVQVESLERACARVISNGGSVITEQQIVPGFGVHVLCKDPQGNFFALIEPLSAK
jgi:predicted enzyme related to lactoylglutathione lyase